MFCNCGISTISMIDFKPTVPNAHDRLSFNVVISSFLPMRDDQVKILESDYCLSHLRLSCTRIETFLNSSFKCKASDVLFWIN